MGKNLILTGMMGVGKSTIGKILAKKLSYNFIDIDKLIEAKEGSSINSIFKNKSESYFRKIENDITLGELKKDNSVISLGGGAFINKKIQREILTNHMSIWLKWDSETLIKRINKSYKRPIAINSSKEELNDLIKKRSNIYSKALYKIDCEKHTKIKIANKINPSSSASYICVGCLGKLSI